MSESFILEFIPYRINQLGYKNYYIKYRDLVLEESSVLTITAYNSLWYIVGNPLGIQVESDYGFYDTLNNQVSENIHQHRGEIFITNPDKEKKRVTFIEAVIIN